MRSTYNFWAFALCLVLMLLSVNLLTPLLPLYKDEFGMAPAMVTMVFAVYAMALLPSLLLFGPLSDSVGRKKVLLGALVVAVAGTTILLFAHGTAFLLIGRVLQGVALGAAQGTVAAALVESEPDHNVGKASTVGSAVTAGGTALGPLTAGIIGQFLPNPLRIPFVFGLALLATAILAAVRIPSNPSGSTWKPSIPKPPESNKIIFWAACASAFIAWAVTALFLGVIPSLVAQINDGIPDVLLAGVFVAAMLLVSAFAQTVIKLPKPSLAQDVGCLLLLVGVVAIALATALSSTIILAIASIMCGLGQGLAFKSAMAQVNAIAPPERKGGIMALVYSVVYVGVAFPVIGVGALSQLSGLNAAVNTFAIVVALICLVITAAVRYWRKNTNSEAVNIG